MRLMTVRTKMVLAYIVAACALIAAIKLLSPVVSHKAYFFTALAAIGIGLFVYASRLKCPHCNSRAFSLRWLMLAYIPKNCASCDRDLFLD